MDSQIAVGLLLLFLVMNKFDLFLKRQATVPFTECFPEYGRPTEALDAARYCLGPVCIFVLSDWRFVVGSRMRSMWSGRPPQGASTS